MKLREDEIMIFGPCIKDTEANLVRQIYDFVACDYEKLYVLLLIIGTDVCLNI